MAELKRDFGSFHSSNVQELISIPDVEYIAPAIPFATPLFEDYRKSGPPFGKDVRRRHFLLEEECTFLNHGAFGAVMKEALDVSQSWQTYTERQPLRFLDRELFPHLVAVIRRLAKFVGCAASDLVLVRNATTAINTVIRNLRIQKGDTIFILSTTYGAVKKLLQVVCEESGATLQVAEVRLPLEGPDEIVQLVKDNLKKDSKIAVFDHIPSNTPFILPLVDIIEICHSRNVPVLIDGAHALGSLPLDLSTLNPDYYVSNCHKWFCCPKGSAFLFVRKELQETTRPLVISHGYGSGFNSEFVWTGLQDYSPYLALNTVLDFWEAVGPDIIRQYMYDLCREAVQLLTVAFGTRPVAPKDMFGTMALVELPPALYENTDTVDYRTAEAIQNTLYYKYNIEVPVKSIQGHLYLRISAHIYNCLEEYQHLAVAVQDMKKKSG
ncbi:hypothetical protein ScPMuIL_012848 [Solemya velum]